MEKWHIIYNPSLLIEEKQIFLICSSSHEMENLHESKYLEDQRADGSIINWILLRNRMGWGDLDSSGSE